MSKRTSYWLVAAGILWLGVWSGCASTAQPVRKLTKPVDETAEELVKIREFKSGGSTRAVVSPADTRQVKIKF